MLTDPVERVALPVHASQGYGNGVRLPALMTAGTYAVDPWPIGLPWRWWDEIGADEAAARGVFTPVHSVSGRPPGSVILAPGDIRALRFILERCNDGCCGMDNGDGPNLACAQCGQAAATRIDVCSYWQEVRLDPQAVRRVELDGPASTPTDWETVLTETRLLMPSADLTEWWSPESYVATGVAMAHLLAASGGAPLRFWPGPAADMFGSALDALLPPGPAPKTVALTGPGLRPFDAAPDISLVPRHPETGEPWQPPGARDLVPLAAELWLQLSSQGTWLRSPATGRLPAGVLRDDPLPQYSKRWLEVDRGACIHTLCRLPAVREPWLRAIYDRMTNWMFQPPPLG
ncbi:hypothetical protein ACFQ0T_33160 [Kitasatospora gansuensis]